MTFLDYTCRENGKANEQIEKQAKTWRPIQATNLIFWLGVFSELLIAYFFA